LPPNQRRVGYVPQDALLFPHLTARENVRFGLRDESSAKGRLEAVVELTEIGPILNQRPATLSGGERQRVALARALATEPALLVLDEPLAALDVELKQRVLPYLLRVRDEAGVPLIYVTHHWGEARLLADEALILREGAVAASGAVDQVLAPEALARLGPLPEAENVLRGRLEVGAGGMVLVLPRGEFLHVPALPSEAGQSAVFTVPADDVFLSAKPLTAVSARNVLEGHVRDLTSSATDVLVRVDVAGSEWLATLTPSAVAELQVTPGKTVHLAIKTHSFRRVR
jgi:molybdate transport system ATP-binding protein